MPRNEGLDSGVVQSSLSIPFSASANDEGNLRFHNINSPGEANQDKASATKGPTGTPRAVARGWV